MSSKKYMNVISFILGTVVGVTGLYFTYNSYHLSIQQTGDYNYEKVILKLQKEGNLKIENLEWMLSKLSTEQLKSLGSDMKDKILHSDNYDLIYQGSEFLKKDNILILDNIERRYLEKKKNSNADSIYKALNNSKRFKQYTFIAKNIQIMELLDVKFLKDKFNPSIIIIHKNSFHHYPSEEEPENKTLVYKEKLIPFISDFGCLSPETKLLVYSRTQGFNSSQLRNQLSSDLCVLDDNVKKNYHVFNLHDRACKKNKSGKPCKNFENPKIIELLIGDLLNLG